MAVTHVSRITQGRIDLRRQPIDLGAVIAHAVETVTPLLREKGHKLSTTQANFEPLIVNGDPTRLVQCVSNILNNAIKYTDAGGEISVRAHGDAEHALIEITDNGSGISPELLPHIF